MLDAQVVSLTAQLRTNNYSSAQERLAAALQWRVTAWSSSPIAALTVQNVANAHSVVAVTNSAEFRGTMAQARAVAQELQNLKASVVMDYIGDGTTDVWSVRAASGLDYSIQEVIDMGIRNGTSSLVNRAVFS